MEVLLKAMIGSLGGLIAWLIDVARGRTVSVLEAFTKVISGGFVSYFMTPVFLRVFGLSDEGFVSAILGILGYKIVEFLSSGEFFEQVKAIILSIIKHK